MLCSFEWAILVCYGWQLGTQPWVYTAAAIGNMLGNTAMCSAVGVLVGYKCTLCPPGGFSTHHYVTNLDFVGILFPLHPDLP